MVRTAEVVRIRPLVRVRVAERAPHGDVLVLNPSFLSLNLFFVQSVLRVELFELGGNAAVGVALHIELIQLLHPRIRQAEQLKLSSVAADGRPVSSPRKVHAILRG